MARQFFLFVFFLIAFYPHSNAQYITGIIEEINDRKPLANVSIVNIYTNQSAISDSVGRFTIAATKGQLVEMRKAGYNTARIRIPQGYIPPFFRIILKPTNILSTDRYASSNLTEFQKDSISNYELYKTALEFPKMTGLDMIQHPFSALSKSNRQKWAFQESYAYFEQEKFIDFTFNDKLITNLTGLTGDSLRVYSRRFRPSYERLRSMNQYEFYLYVKRSVDLYRRNARSNPRSSG